MKLIEHNCHSASIPPSSIPNRHLHRLQQLRPENVWPKVPMGMKRVATLKRVPPLIIPHFQSSCVYPKKIMASEGTRENQSEESQRKGIEEKEEKQNCQKLPPPPEKPLPGDCCGSGCVRCVWDEYYDELDAYNKISKKGSASNS